MSVELSSLPKHACEMPNGAGCHLSRTNDQAFADCICMANAKSLHWKCQCVKLQFGDFFDSSMAATAMEGEEVEAMEVEVDCLVEKGVKDTMSKVAMERVEEHSRCRHVY